MRRPRRSLAVLLVAGTAFAFTPTAGAQEAVTPNFSPTEPMPPVAGSFLDKDEYAPGERIKIFLLDTHRCGYTASSRGFTAPAKLTLVRPGYSLEGATTAIATPGTYQAEIPCGMTGPAVDTFTIKATPTRPPGNPAPKPKIIKPKGAPDTGGGGTAP